MPSSFCASRSTSIRLASVARPRTKNGFSSSFMSADARVEALLARLAGLGEQRPQRLDHAPQLGGVAPRDRGLALTDELVRSRHVARVPDLRRGVLEVQLPRLGGAVERGARQPARE